VNREGVARKWKEYKFVVLIAAVGAALLLWPQAKDRVETSELPEAALPGLQSEMEHILGAIQGVGEVRVLLTADTDGERQIAQDTELQYSGNTAAPEDYSRSSSAVLAGGEDGVVVTRTVYPTYRGALVVCQGGDRPEVRLAVTEAVGALTGLSADRVTVAKLQS